MNLTARQQRFVAEYVIDLNATQAAIRAGYSAGQGTRSAQVQGERLLRNVEVRAAVESRTNKLAKDLGIDAQYVLRTIKATIERCAQAKPVLDRKGDPVYVETQDGRSVAAYTFEANAVLKGAELLGRHLRMFTEKVSVGGADDLPAIKAEMSDLDGARLIAFALELGLRASRHSSASAQDKSLT
ncbi:MAG: terminase small subunit [Burkholderiaceae bacterium]